MPGRRLSAQAAGRPLRADIPTLAHDRASASPLGLAQLIAEHGPALRPARQRQGADGREACAADEAMARKMLLSLPTTDAALRLELGIPRLAAPFGTVRMISATRPDGSFESCGAMQASKRYDLLHLLSLRFQKIIGLYGE